MTWFNARHRKRMDFINDFRPTSKIQLKQVCQWYCNGDIKKAQEMYDYYAKDINLPDFDPIPPNWQQQVKDGANGLMSWIKENQNTLSHWYEFIRQIIVNKGKLPSISSEVEDVADSEPLPPIN